MDIDTLQYLKTRKDSNLETTSRLRRSNRLMAEKLGKFLGITTGVIYGLAAAYGSYVFVDPTRLIYNVVALISAAIYFTVTVFAFYKWYTLSGQSKQKEKN